MVFVENDEVCPEEKQTPFIESIPAPITTRKLLGIDHFMPVGLNDDPMLSLLEEALAGRDDSMMSEESCEYLNRALVFD